VQPRRPVFVPRDTGSQVDGRHTGLLQSSDFALLVVGTRRVHIGRPVRIRRLSAAGAIQGVTVELAHPQRGWPRGQRGMLAVFTRKRVRDERRRWTMWR